MQEINLHKLRSRQKNIPQAIIILLNLKEREREREREKEKMKR
ncbi:MAG: hypothetical protein K7J15_05290 [Candidatus Regiella insecticola]|nr:hypothetical protein [Candidatus Regiella insecticola]